MSESDYETTRTQITVRKPMTASRKTALAGGLFYLLTFVSIPQFVLYAAVRDPNYIDMHRCSKPLIRTEAK